MAFDNMIPQIWSANLLSSLKKNLVYAQAGIVSTDYEGDIQQAGDTVHVHGIGPVTVVNYTRNTDLTPPETLEDERRSIQITESKAFNFQIDDIDQAQTKPKVMAEAMSEAAYALADVADQFVASKYTEAGTTIGSDAAPETLDSPEDAYDLLVALDVALDEAKVPTVNRSVVVPPWFHGLIRMDKRFVGTGSAASDALLRNGQIGEAANFRILKSLNVPNVAGNKFKIQASVPMARSYADQINKVEGYRPERRFADAVKGLHLYGGKVIRPEGLAVAVVNRPS